MWPVPTTELPTPDEIAHRLDDATSARIDADHRASTTDG
jgi:hypothetical protein